MSEWKPVKSAPRDRAVDLWCVRHNAKPNWAGIRLTGCVWNPRKSKDLPFKGWYRMLDDGSYDPVDGPPSSYLGLPAWKPTHWMEIPDGPKRPT